MGVMAEEEPPDDIYAVAPLAEWQSRQGFRLPLGPRWLFIFPAAKQPLASAVGVCAAPRLEDPLLRLCGEARLYLEIVVLKNELWV